MSEINEIVINNLIKLRKSAKLTQVELAEKIGYSDKSISRWENGDVVPDITTLDKIAKLYGVPISVLFEEEIDVKKEQQKHDKITNKLVIALLCVISVWIIATAIYTSLNTFFNQTPWEVFVFAVPCSALLGIIFTAIWGTKKWLFFWISFFSWSLITYFFLQFLDYTMWLLFVLGVPVQIAIILVYNLHAPKKRKVKEDN